MLPLIILELLKKYWQLGIIAILFSIIFIQHFINHNLNSGLLECKVSLAEKNVLIDQLNIESKQEVKKVTVANAEAAKWHKDYLVKNQDIINADVPEDCDGAIKWAIEQAKR